MNYMYQNSVHSHAMQKRKIYVINATNCPSLIATRTISEPLSVQGHTEGPLCPQEGAPGVASPILSIMTPPIRRQPPRQAGAHITSTSQGVCIVTPEKGNPRAR